VLVLATPGGEQPDWSVYAVKARPSYADEGQPFELGLSEPEMLEDDSLPMQFHDLTETRRLISTALRTHVLQGYTFWYVRARPSEQVGADHLRKVSGESRGTLYDLVLYRQGELVAQVHHALFLRPRNPEARFVHLTDLHIASRNDLWNTEIPSIIDGGTGSEGKGFVNFNEHLRKFIRWANTAADAGELDFVWALGDLVDFVHIGLVTREPTDNNWSTLIDMFISCPHERERGNEGLRVPLFTTPGNHDWRAYPYPPDLTVESFGISKATANELDYLYHDTTEEVGKKIEEVHNRLIAEGSPILARSWWGTVTSFGLRGLAVGVSRLWTRLKAILGKYLRQILWLATVSFLSGNLAVHPAWWWWLVALAFAVLAVVVTFVIPGWVNVWVRRSIESLLAIDTDVAGLHDYFLKLNPYFNYAFRLENCYFLVLDTGYDCLTAQSFWDDGGKKVRRIGVRDNILGGSPDTMGFYPPHENYPYSQIAWLERALASIQQEHHQDAGAIRKCRVFVGLHAPPANLSDRDRHQADERLKNGKPVLMQRGFLGRFDIRYGTVNHYLSEFYYLCLGYREGQTHTVTGPGIDAVFAGHAHWSIEFKLQKPERAAAIWKPEVLYGRFSEEVVKSSGPPDHWWGPLLLQTGACGPPSKSDPNPPNFRYVTIDARMGVYNLTPRTLPDEALSTC